MIQEGRSRKTLQDICGLLYSIAQLLLFDGPVTILQIEAAANEYGRPRHDLREFADLIAILERKVGRLIFNGFPTGVEVTHAMIHGGPYPATSDGRSTSVGSQAIFRFARPVCYQDFPDSALPQELRDGNPLGIWRMIDGEFMRGAVGAR